MTDASPPKRSRWAEFAFATLSNAAGTILAAAVLYLVGIAAGLLRPNARLLVTIASGLASWGIAWALWMERRRSGD